MFRTISIMNSLLLFALSFFCAVKSQVSYDLPYTGFACQDASVYYSCPRGYTIKMQSVSYGRNSTEICSDDVPDNKTIDKVCDFPQAFDMLGNICDGQNWCYFVVNDTTFPVTGCDDVYKYMDVDYICEPPIFKIDACEGDKVEFSCPSTSQYIFITNLTYGRLDDNVTCQHESINNTSCFSHEPGLNAVTQLCSGQSSCAFMAYNEILGDPCPGTYKTLSVEYMCADCWDSFNSTSCDTYRSWGECSRNPTWMTAFCRQSCWDCQHRDECSNRYEHSEMCDYWAQIGECVETSTSDWMNYYCRKSCNTCNYLFKGDPEKETTTKFLCESDIIELSCPNNYSLRIDDVHFARWNNFWCQHSSVNKSTETCPSPAGMLDVTRKVCNGRKSCYFEPRTDVFGDKCPGIYKQSQVTFTCQECSNAYDDTECGYKKRAGECESNYEWMFTNCFQTCTECQTKECENVYDIGKSLPICDYWAMKGECEANVEFMVTQCQLSCDWCTDQPTTPLITTTTPKPTGSLAPIYGETCEGGEIEISCQEGYYVQLEAIFFGRIDNLTCTHDSVNTTECQTPEGALERARGACNGRQNCWFIAQSDVWGDPCPGTYKAASVLYTCTACENIEDDSECEQLAAEGQCSVNYTSMMQKCYKTCSQCQNKGCGNNHVSAINCDYWAYREECKKNPVFMLDNCQESCQSCVEFPEYLPSKTENICEADVKKLICPKKYDLQINDVFYGRIDNDTCHHDSVDRFNCTTPDGALEKMKALCTGRNFCFFEARSSLFGDNCPDMYKAASINYTCQLCRNRKTDIECQLMAEQGMCDTDYEVMMHDCYLTCSGCLYKNCGNRYDTDVDCDFWAQLGECENNPNFMGFQCEESCQKCENDTISLSTTVMPDGEILPERSVTICELQMELLECPRDYFIRIADIFYGRTASDICPHESANNTDCLSPDGAVDKSIRVCNGRQSCWFEARSNIFGDNCPETYKFGTATFACQACKNQQSDSFCAEKRSQGECTRDYENMMNNCFKTCSECDTGCVNTYGNDLDCDYFAHKGECFINPGWMNSRCQKSCRICPVMVTTTTTESPYDCTALNDCSSHGRCVDNNTCDCETGWMGDSCEEFTCEDGCGGNDGQCYGPNQCHCHGHVTGINCNVCSIVFQPGPACLPCPMCHNGICVSIDQDTNIQSYLGCYNDNVDSPDFTHHVTSFLPSSSLECMSQCYTLGYKYAALKDATDCYCDDTYGSYGQVNIESTNQCDSLCPSPGDNCGGDQAISVWQVYQGGCQCNDGWSGRTCTECLGENCDTTTTSTTTTTAPPGPTTPCSGASCSTASSSSGTTSSVQSSSPTTSTQIISSTASKDDLLVEVTVVLDMQWRDIYSDVENEETRLFYNDLESKLLVFYQLVDSNVAAIRIILLREGSVIVEHEVKMVQPLSTPEKESFQCDAYYQMQNSDNTDLSIHSGSTLEELCSWRKNYCKNNGNLEWQDDAWKCRCADGYKGTQCDSRAFSQALLIVIIVIACAVALMLVILIVCICIRWGVKKKKNNNDFTDDSHSMEISSIASFDSVERLVSDKSKRKKRTIESL